MASNEGETSASASAKREATIRRPMEPTDGSELPFLVTHWLQNFIPDASGEQGDATQTRADDAAKRAALERIQKATSELASAFTTLGAFGSSTAPALSSSNPGRNREEPTASRNATFADVNRRWAAGLPRNHLNNLVDAAISSTVAVEDVVNHCTYSNLVDAASEAINKQRRNPTTGRTVQDAIDLDKEERNEATIAQLKPSILHRPTHVDFNLENSEVNEKPRSKSDPLKMPALESHVKQLQKQSSQAMRQYLDLKSGIEKQASELRRLKSSIDLHTKTKATLQQARLAGGASIQTAEMEISEEEQNADRVLAQIQRKIGELVKTHDQTTEDLKTAKKEAYSMYDTTKKSLLNYRDPIRDAKRQQPSLGMKGAQSQGILHALENRRLGIQNRLVAKRALPKMEPSAVKTNRIRNALMESRLSHAVTINAHCHNPVYSVRFDRTGRYFITGADDNLIKVFQTRAKQAVDARGKGPLGQGQHRTIRGAVLCCTFRGHASVINEIDVSPDNCFLATASEDGDCRVWGLKDGTPIALLRGHVGGCNAVSWSKLTPYRLLTAGHDGFARCWDIRLAALKRYGVVVGNRPEYRLPLTAEERASNAELRNAQEQSDETNDAVNLPPIPERQDQSEIGGTTRQGSAQVPAQAALPDQAPPEAAAPVPPGTSHQGPALPDHAPLAPLPPPPLPAPIARVEGDAPAADGDAPPADGDAAMADAAAPAGDAVDAAAANMEGDQGADANEIAQPGLFIANDIMDEGVRLVWKYQHGTVTDETIAGPGTRSGRGKVKVLLFARCPLGGHFATGASDGTCRIWEDIDDPDVETVDRRFSKSAYDWIDSSKRIQRRTSSRSVTNRLLLELKGFMNPTTDLQYSHSGDRILVGSMLDGVLRIWSWDVDPSVGSAKGGGNERGLRSIVIKLTNPLKSKLGSAKTTRRRARGSGSAANNASKILLDMAVWTNDDSKIITSQSQPINALKIEPDSNFMFLWDSKTGHCLLGIAGGHSRSTPVILPHPTNASIFCSGGADGYIKVWDCDTGKCLFSHRNEHQLRYLVDATPQEPCGLLNDGAFFPDGTGFVFSDSTGNVLLFDSILPASDQKSSSPSLPPAAEWMKEQYRANDYYDLKYEVNGYLVEQGCNLPPHLAPRGVRCTHSGAPFADSITEAFQNLIGPGPLPIQDCQLFRQYIRCRGRAASNQANSSSSRGRRGNIMQEYDPLTTVLVSSAGQVIETRNEKGEIINPTIVAATPAAQTGAVPARRDSTEERRSSNSGRLLSNNYRWRDYTDMLAEERLLYDEDSDDEEFQPAPRSRGGRTASGAAIESDESDDEMELESPSPQRRSTQRSSTRPAQQRPAPRQTTRRTAEVEEQRPSRASSRRAAIERERYGESDEEEEVVEFLSTNNDPSGVFVRDYQRHFFRLPAGQGKKIERGWLRRLDSNPGYQGCKAYSPQVGDTVVYIPRAHFEWIQAFPSLNAPWQHWPEGSEWPVVCLCIRDIRYRFPFSDFHGSRNSNRNQCNSIVAILSVEVTGIPVLSQDRDFNWPDPHFIPPARSHTFELDLFKSAEFEEFLIPFDRYVWRLQCLEEAVVNNHGLTDSIEISAYYEDEQARTPDADFVLYQGHLDEYAQRDRVYNDENLNSSGYASIRIRWPEDNQDDTLSPWEVNVDRPRSRRFSLSRHCLDDEEKKQAADALKKLKRLPSVREQFMYPVNIDRYIDYLSRVELPMHLEFIEQRLEANYYSSRWSIVADVKLIRENCIKYNGEVGLLQDEARQMYEEFEKEMLSEEERRINNDPAIASAPARRDAQRTRSSLENLPAPVGPETNRRHSLRIQFNAAQVQQAQQATEATTGRALRSNSQAADFPREMAHSASFANQLQNTNRRRQSRRRSNGSDNAEPDTRGRRAPAAAAAVAHAATRRSSRVRAAPAADPVDHGIVRSNPRPQRRRSSANSVQHSPPAAAAIRQTRSRGAPQEPASESESDAKPAARPTRRSSSRFAAVEHADSEEESASESESEHRSSQQGSRRPSRARKPAARYEDSEETPSPRKKPATRKQKTRDESDGEESENVSAEEEEDERSESGQSEAASGSELESEASAPARRSSTQRSSGGNASRAQTTTNRSTTSRARAQPSSADADTAQRRSSRGDRVSYVEKSESEFEDFSEDDISEDEDQMLSPHKRPARSRGATKKPASRKRPAKNKAAKSKKQKPKPARAPRKRQREEYESEESDDGFEMPTTPRTTSRSRAKRFHPWPDIDQKDITRVTMGMLEYLRNMDEDQLFENPVLETLPEIKHEYLQKITTPMDFRTIEEERIHYYTSITELQRDLILIFQNCIRFNGEISQYAQFAQQMIDMLDDAFENIMDGLGCS